MARDLYDAARTVCHEFGMEWTDPRTGITHQPPTLLPTHTCFDDAFEYIEHRVTREPSAVHTLILVHAIALHDNGEPFAHAWVEEGGWCWAAGMLEGEKIFYAAQRDEFIGGLRARQMTRYTMREVSRMNRRYGNFGPWDRRYRRHCNR